MWDAWGPAIANGICALFASVLAALILRGLRKAREAALGAQTASEDASKHAQAAASTQVTALDVASLQGWARGVDVQLAGIGDDRSMIMALSADLDRIKRTLAEWEREFHGKDLAADSAAR